MWGYNVRFYLSTFILILLYVPCALSFDMDPPDKTVHQHISNESKLVWNLVTPEIENHLTNPIDSTAIDSNYDPQLGDDVITASAEEDQGFTLPFLNHFWEPDDPNTPSMSGNDDYNDGLAGFDSSYRRAMNFWRLKVIPYYLKGDIYQSYYWLGHVAHLLEDAAQPSHIHLDPHFGHREFPIIGPVCGGLNPDCDDSFLERHTGDNFHSFENTYNWSGENFAAGQYNYENLPNMESFNWATVEPTNSIYKPHIGLFRLFWYTAQKTQYLTSDNTNKEIIHEL